MNSASHPLRDPRRNVEINVGKACNNRCVFCIDGLPKAEDRSYMDIDHMKGEIARFYELGNRSLGFLGGEPTTYPKLPEAIRYASDMGYTRIAIATNATKLRLTHYTDRLIDAGLTRVTVSMHGHTSDLEDRLTRVPGNFRKKVVALRYLVKLRDEGKLRDNVSVNIVVNGWNYKYMPQMMRFFYRLGLDDIRANFVRTEGYALDDASVTPRFTDVVPYIMKAVMLNEFHYRKSFTLSGFPLCTLPWEFLANSKLAQKVLGEFRDLDTDCSVRSESDTPFGIEELGEGRARFNWQDRKRADLKIKPDQCLQCRYDNVCEGVWNAYPDFHGLGEITPIP